MGFFIEIRHKLVELFEAKTIFIVVYVNVVVYVIIVVYIIQDGECQI